MAAPVWKTTAGSLGKINEQQNFSFQLEAEDADSTALTYSKIAGTLPSGIELTADGTLQGVPSEVSTRSLYKDRKSTRLNSSHVSESRMPSSA